MAVLRVERRKALAVVWLDKERGNAIDERLLGELEKAAAELGPADAVRGILLASAHPRLFCPGLDLVSLASYGRQDMRRFMLAFGRTVRAWYGLRKPVVAAVSGHAVAGGCILAMTADLRLLKRGAQIGLNEVKVGVPLPWPVSVLLRASVPPNALTKMALLGRNFADEEALAVGLADAVLEAEGYEEGCLAALEELAQRDPRALGQTKQYLRAPALAEMQPEDEARVGEFLDAWFSDETQDRIRGVIASLGSRG